ncbi:unnamed protein product, partial [Rotaria socialis]
QRQLSADGGRSENDLIAFDDGDGYGLSQASSLSATKETISLIYLEDDSNNADRGEWENLSARDKDDDDDVDDMNDSENGDEDVGGIVQNDWESLRALFEQNFQNNVDLGASLAVYHRGKLVVNLWGGWFDKQKTKPYDNDTLQLVFSTPKGLVAMTIALCVQRGLLNYTDKVIKYWPEYGQSDKENTTVADVMSHRAGLPALRNSNLSTHEYLDWYSVIHKLEKQNPYWVPGTQHGYHAYTYGWLAGELVRRVVHQAEISAANGITNAKSIARLYASLIGDLDVTKRLLNTKILKQATKSNTPENEPDQVLMQISTIFGMGFMTYGSVFNIMGPGTFGHNGLGGSIGFASPSLNLSFAYVTNLLDLESSTTVDPRIQSIMDKITFILKHLNTTL